MFHLENNDEAPFGVALASVAGISDEALTAAWRSGLITSATNRLLPPSRHVAQEIIDSPTTVIEHHALASCLRDSDMLHDLLVKHPSAVQATEDSCFMTRETTELVANSFEGQAMENLALRLAVPETYPASLTAEQASAAAGALLMARFATQAAQLFDAVADGSASQAESDIVNALIELVVTGEDPNAGDHRRFRSALLELVSDDARQSLVFKISETQALLGTASDWKHIVDLIDEGLLFEDEVETRVDGDAWLWSKLTGNSSYEAFAAFGVSSGVTNPSKSKGDLKGRKAVQIDSTADEAELMALLGYSEVAARTVLDSNATVSLEELEEALDAADAETVIDWAEGRLPRRPFTGDVTKQMIRMGTTRMVELAKEVQVRPDPLKQNNELIVMTPGIAAMQIDPKSARALVEFLHPRVSGTAWSVLLSLLSDNRDNDTVIELLDAALALAGES